MVSWFWSRLKFDWIEELTQIDWLKIVQINHKAFSRLAYSQDASIFTRRHKTKVSVIFLIFTICLINHNNTLSQYFVLRIYATFPEVESERTVAVVEIQKIILQT